MSYSLQNKTVFITGASSGIGEASAELFAKAGARVLVCARRGEKIEALVQRLQQTYGVEAEGFVLDVGDAEAIQATLAALKPAWQAIDVLVNNAGFALGLASFAESDPRDWEAMLNVNVKGVLHVTQFVLKGMLARNRGHIINLSSISGIETYPKAAIYCATKFALEAFSQSLNMDLIDTKLRVSTVRPGKVQTEFSEVRFKGDKTRAEQEYVGYEPLMAEDIAETVYFCASRPEHMNIREITVMPSAQASALLLNKA